MVVELFTALAAEIRATRVAGRLPYRIHVTDYAFEGSIVSMPISDAVTDELIGCPRGAYEIVIHPNDWEAITAEGVALNVVFGLEPGQELNRLLGVNVVRDI